MGDFSTVKMNNNKINKHQSINAYIYGNVLEITNTKTKVKSILPLPDKKYVDLKTGEIKQFKTNNQRIQSPENLRKTFRNLRRLIIANFGPGDLWLTFTYRQNDGKPMTDTIRVYRDYKAFWRRFISKYGSCDYLCSA